jgi:hypothetical protein
MKADPNDLVSFIYEFRRKHKRISDEDDYMLSQVEYHATALILLRSVKEKFLQEMLSQLDELSISPEVALMERLYYECLLGNMLVSKRGMSWTQLETTLISLKEGQAILVGEVEPVTSEQK